MTDSSTPTLSRILTPIYIQALLRYLAMALTGSYIVLYARQMGVSLSWAGLITSAGMLGTMCFDLPAGNLVRKLGERRSMLIGSGSMCLLSLLLGLVRDPVSLGVLLFLNGVVMTLVMVGQLSYMRKVTRRRFRGRALSSLGGTVRVAGFFGPMAGGYLAEQWGFPPLFYLRSLLLLVSLLVFWIFAVKIDPEHPTENPSRPSPGLWRVFRTHSSDLLRGGLSMVFLSLIRTSRVIIMPLWGESLGLDLSQIGLVIGIAGGLEMFMFIPAGRIMDKGGRRTAAVLCLGLFSVGLLLLPLVPRYWWFLSVALFIAVGNGLGSGINMTVGSDLAPRENPGQFLGFWRLISDSGGAVAPLAIGAISQAMALTPSILIIGGAGLLGAALMFRILPETRHNRQS